MFKQQRSLVLVAGLVGLVVFAAVAWWLASPLFISNAVDEAFPFAMPSAAEMEAMTEEEKMAKEAEFMAAVPSEAEVAVLSAADREAVETAVNAAAALVMTDHPMEDPMPEAPAEWAIASQGQFRDADSFHMGSGTATIYQQNDQRVLRLENFEVTNGPDLHVVLSKNPNPTSRDDLGDDHVDLGSLKGNLGSQNYDIPARLDLSEYQSVVIYCMPFHVVFSVATLG